MRNVLRGLFVVCLVGTATSVHAWSSRIRAGGGVPIGRNSRNAAGANHAKISSSKQLENLNQQRTTVTATRNAKSSSALNNASKNSGNVAKQNRNATWARPLLAEFIGTFIIVQFGTGAVMSAIFEGALVGLFQIAAVWGIAVTLAIYCTAHISGAHLNPSITVALALLRQFSWKQVIPYILAQLSGATLASWINLLLYSDKIRAFESANNIIRGSIASVASAKAFGEYYLSPVGTPVAILGEVFGTAMLAFVIFSLTNPRNETMKKNSFYVPPLIGLCVAGLISVIAPINQAGFNPARDFGPRIVAWLAGWKSIAFLKWWVYVVGPIIGAPVGAFLAEKVLYGMKRDDESNLTV